MRTSSSGESEKGQIMATPMPAALRERLGDEATYELIEVIQTTGREWRDNVLDEAVGRFERRLIEETGKLRLEMTREMTQLRLEMTHGMAEMKTDLREDIAAARIDILRWSFLFWIGQVAAVMGLLTFLVRTH